MNTTPQSLWELIESLTRQLPLTPESVTKSLGVPLQEVAGTNDQLRYWKSGEVRFKSGVAINAANLRVRRDASARGLLQLDLSGECIPLEEVRRNYSKLEMDRVNVSSDASLVSFSTKLAWGKLSFTFLGANARCVSSVVIDPNA